MRIRKAMAVLFAVVLMAGILPTRIFAASTDIVIPNHTAGNLSAELSTVYANGCPRDQVTSIAVSSGEITADDWSALFSAVINSNHITTMNLSGTTTSAPVPSDMFSCQTNVTSVTLPSGSYSINDRVFSGCTGLTSITILGNVTSIGYAAFSGCKSLTSISIPASVTSIGEDAFSGCENLSSITGNIVSFGKEIFCGCTHLTSITIPSTITSIGDGAFENCASLSTVTIPQSVTSIGNGAFEGCTHLNSVTFNGTPNITKIGYSAFEGDINLNSITIPAKVTTIDYRAFYGCASLKSVIMNADTTISIHNTAFQNLLQEMVLMVPAGSENTWDTSDGRTDHRVQLGGKQLKIENLPPLLSYHITRVSDTQASIDISSDEDGVYYYKIVPASDADSTVDTSGGGKSLNDGRIDANLSAGPYKLYIIAKDSLGNIMNDTVNIDPYCEPKDLTIDHTVGNFATELTGAMTAAGIPAGRYDLIKSLTVSGGAFNDTDWQALANAYAMDVNHNPVNMVNVRGINLSGVSSTSSVPDYTFSGLYSLQSVVLPSGVTGLGEDTFKFCNSLTSVTLPSSVTSIGKDAFEDCSSLASLTIPNSVTFIGDGAFADCSSLASITIPNHVTSIITCTFSGCSSLVSVTIPSSVTSIGESTFENCSSLTSVTIPSSVASIDAGAFSGCSSLSSITSLAATPPVLEDGGSYFFSGLPSTGTLTVPSGSTAAYTSAWGSYLPDHWTITAAGSPAPNGGGASSGNSAYNANVSGSGSQTTLPVTVDAGSKTASVDLGSQSFSQTGAVITVPSIPDTHTYSAKLSVSDLSTSTSKGTLTVKTGNGSITVPSNMLTSGTSGSKANISIGQADKTALPANVKTAIGDHPLISLSMTIDGKQTEWSNPKAPVTVSIPYTPTAAELQNPNSIVIWYIDGSGKAISVPTGHYDPKTGTVTFQTTHFSNYAITYIPVSFNDVTAGAWYCDAVSFIAARNITSGTDSASFSPDAALTRGQFLVMMLRAYGISADANPSGNFSDAGNTYYTGYLAAAKRLNIANGVGGNLFEPEKEISRQEMFTLLYNTLKSLDKLPSSSSGKTLSSFSDAGSVASWAEDAMTYLVQSGTVSGNGVNLTPTDTTTRAELAQVLKNLLIQ